MERLGTFSLPGNAPEWPCNALIYKLPCPHPHLCSAKAFVEHLLSSGWLLSGVLSMQTSVVGGGGGGLALGLLAGPLGKQTF